MYSIIKILIVHICSFFGVYISKIKPTRKETLNAFFAQLRENSAQVNLIRIGGNGDGGYLLPNDLDDLRL